MDIVERLRKVDKSIWLSALAEGTFEQFNERLMVGEWSHEAADEIERLRGALRIIRDDLGDTPQDSMKAYEIAEAALKDKDGV